VPRRRERRHTDGGNLRRPEVPCAQGNHIHLHVSLPLCVVLALEPLLLRPFHDIHQDLLRKLRNPVWHACVLFFKIELLLFNYLINCDCVLNKNALNQAPIFDSRRPRDHLAVSASHRSTPNMSSLVEKVTDAVNAVQDATAPYMKVRVHGVRGAAAGAQQRRIAALRVCAHLASAGVAYFQITTAATTFTSSCGMQLRRWSARRCSNGGKPPPGLARTTTQPP